MKDQDYKNTKKENRAIANQESQESSKGISIMPPPFSFDSPPVQKKRNQDLPEEIQAKMENGFGHDFSNVNIHKNSDSAIQMKALAYAQGNDVHFAPGQFNPNSQKGQELIGHEFAHVVQQREGRVKATKQAKGMPVNDNKALEKEADIMGAKATKGKVITQLKHINNKTTSQNSIVQKRDDNESQQQNQCNPSQHGMPIQNAFSISRGSQTPASQYIFSANPTILLWGNHGSQLGEGCINFRNGIDTETIPWPENRTSYMMTINFNNARLSGEGENINISNISVPINITRSGLVLNTPSYTRNSLSDGTHLLNITLNENQLSLHFGTNQNRRNIRTTRTHRERVANTRTEDNTNLDRVRETFQGQLNGEGNLTTENVVSIGVDAIKAGLNREFVINAIISAGYSREDVEEQINREITEHEQEETNEIITQTEDIGVASSEFLNYRINTSPPPRRRNNSRSNCR